MTDEPRRIGDLVEPVVDHAAKQRAWLAERGLEITDDEAPPELESPAQRAAAAWSTFAPLRFGTARLDDLLDLPAQLFGEVADWCAAALAGLPGNLLLIGPVGTGKSHTAFAVCRHLIDAGKGVRWWPTVELLDGLRPGGDVDIDQAVGSSFVFLDDLGGEKPTDWVAERLYLIVNRRWLDGRPLIATTNLEVAELREAIGTRTWDRLRDGSTAVRFVGASRRAGAQR